MPLRSNRFPPQPICIALSSRSVDDLLRKSAVHAQEFPFQELRLDDLDGLDDMDDRTVIFSSLRAHLAALPNLVVIATCRGKASGGHFQGTPEDEFHILREAVHAGCHAVDLAIESAERLPPEAVRQLQALGAAVLVSWHDFHGTPDLQPILQRMRRFAPDLYKIVPTAATLADNLQLLRLFERAGEQERVPIVGIAMGEAGVMSRVLGVRGGSAFTFAAAALEEGTAPGQLDARTLRDLYRLASLNKETQLFGVAGDPIRSSMSPLMLNTAFQRASQDAVYLPLRTHNATELFQVARALPLQGFSVTMPLKQAVLPFVQHIDPLAARIGAVNTVRREPDGSFSGFNTDAAGITAPLERRIDLRDARVLVLGAGGAARAAVFACAERGAKVSILNRTFETAEKLATEAGAEALRSESLPSLPPFDVLINATPAGMRGNPAELPLAPDDLRAKLVFDLVYNPLKTPLLKAAQARGLETIAGVEMFVHQGARQFELWTGRQAPLEAMRDVVLSALAQTDLRG